MTPTRSALIAGLFIDEASERLGQLADAIEVGDAARLRKLAHGLKGSAATVGAARMRELSRELCELAARGKTDGADAVHGELAEALSQTSTALNAYIANAGE